MFFQTPQTLQVKNARCKSWGAAHERTNAVSSVFYAYWRNRSHVRGRGIMKRIPALMTWHCVLFLFTYSIPGCGNLRARMRDAVVRLERSASD